MAKKDKKSKASKATESSKAARKALKEGLAKPTVEVSAHALEGEDPQWSVQLDALREADLAAGMNEKAARVQRQQRLRKLKKGETLPQHGGLNDLQEPEVVEPVIASDTEADDDSQNEGATEVDVSIPDERSLSKKERKRLLKQQAEAAAVLEAEQVAAQQRAEEDRIAKAAEIAAATTPADPERELSKKERKALKKAQAESLDQQEVAAYTAQVTPEPEPETPSASISDPAPAAASTRRDNSLIALQAAQVKANESGKKQKVVMPRKYKTKNYGAKLITTYTAKDPNLVLTYNVEDTFDQESGFFTVTITVLPAK
jgi:hypothetical protein